MEEEHVAPASTRQPPQGWPTTAYLLVGMVVGALGLWGLERLWVFAGRYDAGPRPNGLQEQLMRRKADAMHDLLDAMAAGRLDQVDAEAGKIEGAAATIESYLATEIYEVQGAAFEKALKDVRQAARGGDQTATKQATLRLEKACLDCHQAFNETADDRRWR